MNLARVRKPCLVVLSRFFREISSVAGESSVFDSASFIHPTVLFIRTLLLGVSIGPSCTVRSPAKIGDSCQLYSESHVFGNTELGDNCVLMTGSVAGDELPGSMLIGCNNCIGHHAVIGAKCQDLKYKVIADNNLIMGSCHIAHDCKIGNSNIFANSTLLAGHVVVEDYVHSAGAVVVHQFCHLGSFSFIGGGRSELRGLNLEGLRRHGFTGSEMRSLRMAYQRIFMPSNANSVGFVAWRIPPKCMCTRPQTVPFSGAT